MRTLARGVPFASFPPSLRHGMLVAQSLAIDYFWIDCYCVLQGHDEASRRDWEVESKQMGSIYANGILNIGVSHVVA